jgi:hypothetical protein
LFGVQRNGESISTFASNNNVFLACITWFAGESRTSICTTGTGRMCAVRNLATGAIYGADGTRFSTGAITMWGSCDPSECHQALRDSNLGPSGGQLTETGVDANGDVVWAHTNVWVGGRLLATYDPHRARFQL